MEKVYEATIEFNTNKDAEDFAIAYSRKTLRGHTVAQNKVSIYGITEDDKKFIDSYIENLNKGVSND